MTMLRQLAQVALLTMLLGDLLTGQERQNESPVPVLSRGGLPPKGSEGKFVFLDPSSGNAVILYTAQGKSAAVDPFGSDVVRVEVTLNHHVEPYVRASFAKGGDASIYEYSYELHNGGGARERAWKWLFEGVGQSDTAGVKLPQGWIYRFPQAQVGGIKITEKHQAADALLRSLQLLTVDARGAIRAGEGIEPGAKTSGIVIASKRAPGVVRVLVQGGLHVAAFPDVPPAGASEELDALIRSEYNYARTWTIGPKFTTTTPRTVIAQQYLRDLEALEAAQWTEATPDFLETMKIYLQQVSNGKLSPVPSASLAETRFERELLAALSETLAQGPTHR